MARKPSTDQSGENRRLREELERSRQRAEEAEQALDAIRTGQAESLVVEGPNGPRIFSLESADHSYRMLIEAMNEGAAAVSENGTILYSNRRFAAMLGAPLERVMGSALLQFVSSHDHQAFQALMRAANEGESRAEIELLGETGQVVPSQLSLSVMHEGGLRLFCLVAADLRLHKRILNDLAAEKDRLEKARQEVVRSEHAVRASLREKEVLLKEIHHRVKNNLQVISSLLNLQARYLNDPAAREMFKGTQTRVQSMALVHEKLHQSTDLSHIDFAGYVASLVDNLFHTHGASERGIVRELELGSTRLAIDVALPCGLIINELITNSVKHAFRDNGPGTVRVELRPLDAQHLELTVADDGVGLPADLDPRKSQSLGLDLVFTFAEQIGAAVEITREGGTRFRFTFAADQGAN